MPPAPTDLLAIDWADPPVAVAVPILLGVVVVVLLLAALYRLDMWLCDREVLADLRRQQARCPVCQSEHQQVSLMPDHRGDGRSEAYGYCDEHLAVWRRIAALEIDFERGNQ